MKFFRKSITVLLILTMCISLFSCTLKSEPATTGAGKKGLFVNNYGTIYLDDKPFYGYGICMFSTFMFHLNNLESTAKDNLDKEMLIKDAYKADFAFCNAYDIPVVRIPFSTWDANSYKIFENDPDKFFRAMDDIVEEAEKCHVGIIPSLLWNQDALPFYVQEKRAAYGNAQSATTEFAKNYVSAIVERYKDSPAVFGWEIGNEYNLNSDLCDPLMKEWSTGAPFKVGKASWEDYYSSGELIVFYTEISNLIRSIDPDRMITTGNGVNRSCSYAAHQNSEQMDEFHFWNTGWGTDTREQHMEMMDYFTPAAINTICFHFQHGTNGSDNPSTNFESTTSLEGEVLNTKDYIALYVEAGKKYKKAVYYGEFGDFLDMENMKKTDMETFKVNFSKLMDWMYEDNLQLATGWFNWAKGKGDRFNHTLINLSEVNQYKMEELQRINGQFKADGKQETEAYWALYEN